MTPTTSVGLDIRLAKVGGQIDGIRGMLHAGRPCIEVLDQIAAARAALDAVAARLVIDEVRQSVTGAAAEDLSNAINRLARR